MDGEGRYNGFEVDSNFLTGYYGRDGFINFIKNNVDADTLLYINKEKATILETESSTSWLEQLKNYDFNVIIRKTRADVKTKFSAKDSTGRELSEGQQEYFKDSTVRDENGNLLVMYRGDANDFTVFDRKKSKPSNLYGRGFYFTNSKAHAEQYGDTREFYLDIKNPLSPKKMLSLKSRCLISLRLLKMMEKTMIYIIMARMQRQKEFYHQFGEKMTSQCFKI